MASQNFFSDPIIVSCPQIYFLLVIVLNTFNYVSSIAAELPYSENVFEFIFQLLSIIMDFQIIHFICSSLFSCNFSPWQLCHYCCQSLLHCSHHQNFGRYYLFFRKMWGYPTSSILWFLTVIVASKFVNYVILSTFQSSKSWISKICCCNAHWPRRKGLDSRSTLKHFSYISSDFFIIEYQSGHRKYIFFYSEIHLSSINFPSLNGRICFRKSAYACNMIKKACFSKFW